MDHQDDKKEEAFLTMQEYLLSKEAQTAVEATGRRISAQGVSQSNSDIFRKEWGIDVERILSPIQMPDADVLLEALKLYQTSFKKPSLNIDCLDFSGSMSGEGQEELTDAMAQILIQENAKQNFLQANDGEVNIAVLFSGSVRSVLYAADSSGKALEALYQEIEGYGTGGGTDIYTAVGKALELAGNMIFQNIPRQSF